MLLRLTYVGAFALDKTSNRELQMEHIPFHKSLIKINNYDFTRLFENRESFCVQTAHSSCAGLSFLQLPLTCS